MIKLFIFFVLVSVPSIFAKIIDNKLNPKLLECASNNDIDGIKKLFSSNIIPNINTENKHGATVLMIASVKNNENIVKLLIDKGANVEAKDNYGHTALMYACQNNHITIVKMLIEAGADVNAKDCEYLTARDYSKDKGLYNYIVAERKTKIKSMIDEQPQLTSALSSIIINYIQEYTEE
jgi:ankyrin repeat protein